MPHLILEASANIHESNIRIRQALAECQDVLVKELPTQLSTCKSRVVLHDIYVVGDDDLNNAFIHLTVKLLKGRTPELLQKVAKILQDVISNNFIRSRESLNLSVSVEIIELSDAFVK